MANKVVQLVDKNSNNLYPIAGSVITDAVSTTAISNQAVTNPKIENGAVNGVANDATAIGTAKLALDTVGTPNLRDESVTSDKIDWTTIIASGGVTVLGEVGSNYLCCLNVEIPSGSITAGQQKEFSFSTNGYPLDTIQFAIGTVNRVASAGVQRFLFGSSVPGFNSSCYGYTGDGSIKILIYTAETRMISANCSIYFTSPKP